MQSRDEALSEHSGGQARGPGADPLVKPGPQQVVHPLWGPPLRRNWLRLAGHRSASELLLHRRAGLGPVLSLQLLHH